jgi:hypothetical protein
MTRVKKLRNIEILALCKETPRVRDESPAEVKPGSARVGRAVNGPFLSKNARNGPFMTLRRP